MGDGAWCSFVGGKGGRGAPAPSPPSPSPSPPGRGPPSRAAARLCRKNRPCRFGRSPRLQALPSARQSRSPGFWDKRLSFGTALFLVPQAPVSPLQSPPPICGWPLGLCSAAGRVKRRGEATSAREIYLAAHREPAMLPSYKKRKRTPQSDVSVVGSPDMCSSASSSAC